MGPQGKRWPKWKQRRDNSKEEVTRENREKKLHYGVKCIRKVSGGVLAWQRMRRGGSEKNPFPLIGAALRSSPPVKPFSSDPGDPDEARSTLSVIAPSFFRRRR